MSNASLGYRKIGVKLREEGWRVNKKRVARLWRQHGLGVPTRPVKRRRLGPQVDGSERYRAERPHQVWAVDFLFDATIDGRQVKILTVTDEGSKACLLTHAARSIRAVDVIARLEALMTRFGPPEHLRSDHGPEFVANAIQRFLSDAGTGTLFIEPGAPWQNPFAESFHARLRDELLDRELFAGAREADIVIDTWRRYYNEERPHGALNDATPAQALHAGRAQGSLGPTPTPTP